MDQETIASWKYEDETYKIVAGESQEENTYSFKDFMEDLEEHDRKLLLSLRDGEVEKDPKDILKAVKLNIDKGKLTGTRESILKKFYKVGSHFKQVKQLESKMFESIYSATVNSGQAALIANSEEAPVQRQVPDMLEESFIKKAEEPELSKHFLEYCRTIIKEYKKFDHGKRSIPKGKEFDRFRKKMEDFKDAMTDLY